MSLNVLVIGDPHCMDSSVREIDELTAKVDKLFTLVNGHSAIDTDPKTLQFEDLSSFFVETKPVIKSVNINMGALFPQSISPQTAVSIIADNQVKPPDTPGGFSEKIDIAVLMGDLFDKHERNSVYAQVSGIKLLKAIKKHVPLFVLIGNHDRPNNSDFLSDFHFLYGLEEVNNLYIVDKVKCYNITKRNIRGAAVDNEIGTSVIDIQDAENEMGSNRIPVGPYNFMFVPYVPNGRFMEALNSKPWCLNGLSTVKCIFGHQEIYGVKYNGISSQTGDKLELQNNPLMVMGHIHEYGKVPYKNITYVGSSRQIARNESPDKTVSIFKFDTNNGGIVGNNYKEIRIDLNLMKKVVVRIKAADISTFIPMSNAITYLIIEGSSTEMKALKKLIIFKDLEKTKTVKFSYDIKDAEDTILNEDQTLATTNGVPKDVAPYIQRLRDRVKDNPKQLAIFQKLFN